MISLAEIFARLKRGESQAEIAASAGVSRQAISARLRYHVPEVCSPRRSVDDATIINECLRGEEFREGAATYTYRAIASRFGLSPSRVFQIFAEYRKTHPK